MAGNRDPQRRPVFIDRVNNRFLADPAIGSKWEAVSVTLNMLPPAGPNVVVGRLSGTGDLQLLSSDVLIDLVNTATSSVIAAARVAAGSTTTAGVLQLTDSTASTSTSTAATPNSVKNAFDVASAALPRSGGTMTGQISFAAGQTISGYLPASAVGVSVQPYSANTAFVNAAQTFTAAQRGAYVTLTDAATVTVDMSLGNHFQVTLGGNRTLGAPTNVVAGQSGVIRVVQDATGSRTMAFNSVFKFPGGVAPTLTTAANSVDLLAFHVESATRIAVRFIGDVK